MQQNRRLISGTNGVLHGSIDIKDDALLYQKLIL